MKKKKPKTASKPFANKRNKNVKRDVGKREKTLSMRLQRILATAGFGSRRKCEELITEGRVQVDKVVVTKLGSVADPETQKIFVDGERVKFQKKQYFALNKPAGVISTSRDPSGRARVIDLIETDQRVFTVGRLDKSSEGLILVTNDGELANRLTHPKFGIEKVYHVHVAGCPGPDDLKMLKQGVYLAEGFAQVQKVKLRNRRKNFSELEIVLDEGRNREIRRLLARIGHKVLRLKRVAIGPLKLGELPLGAHRKLTRDEIRSLERTTSSVGSRTAKRTKKPNKKRAPARQTSRDEKPASRYSKTDKPRTSKKPNKKRAPARQTSRDEKPASRYSQTDKPRTSKKPNKKRAPARRSSRDEKPASRYSKANKPRTSKKPSVRGKKEDGKPVRKKRSQRDASKSSSTRRQSSKKSSPRGSRRTKR